MGRGAVLACALGLALAAAGCGGDGDASEDSRRSAAACPPAWLAGWQRLANRIDAPVYCPRWMPNPLDGDIAGSWSNIESVDSDRSYLISFLWHEAGAAGGDVHVNFRGYPGRTRIPTCVDVNTVAGVTRRRKVPCFSDYQGEKRLGRLRVGVYTVNQDSDQWHILYAWRRNGTLYTVSQHVARPLTYRKVVQSLDRITRDLALVVPRKAGKE